MDLLFSKWYSFHHACSIDDSVLNSMAELAQCKDKVRLLAVMEYSQVTDNAANHFGRSAPEKM